VALRQSEFSKKGIRDDHRYRYEWVEKSIATGEDFRVLDFGCGTGYGSHILHISNKFDYVLGADIDFESIQIASTLYSVPGTLEYRQENLENHWALFGILESLRWARGKKKEIIVCAFEVIEHLKNPGPSLYILSKKCSHIFCSVPNEKVSPYTPGVSHPDHKRHYTVGEITELLQENGWCIEIVMTQLEKEGLDSQVSLGVDGRTLVIQAISKEYIHFKNEGWDI